MKKSITILTVILLLTTTTVLTACTGNPKETTPPTIVQPSPSNESSAVDKTESTPVQSSDTPNNALSTTVNSKNTDIGVEKAKENVLIHAGLSASDVTFVKEKLEMDDGLREYDIDFISDTTKYDYDINSIDGTVMQFSQESIIQTSSPNTPISGDIGIEKAKEIALEHAGFSASDVTFIKIKLDYDDGVPEYEVDFVVNKIEHDYSIHATNGTIIEFETEKY